MTFAYAFERSKSPGGTLMEKADLKGKFLEPKRTKLIIDSKGALLNASRCNELCKRTKEK